MKSEVFFNGIEGKIIEELKSAEYSIDIAVAWITNTGILNCLNDCASRGLNIRIITVKDHINKVKTYEKLYYKGASIRLMSSRMMHNKFCIIDNHKIVSGSFNWTANANYNHENITVTYGDNSFANEYIDEFNKLFNKSVSIGNLVPIDMNIIEELEEEFNNFKIDFSYKMYSWPYLYFIPEDNIKKTGSNRHGEIESGYYYITSKSEHEEFIKYIFYSRCNQNYYKLSQIIDLPSKISVPKINKIIGVSHKTEDIIRLSNKSLVEIGSSNEIAEISKNSEISNTRHRIISKFNNSYLVRNNEGLKYINSNFSSNLNYVDNSLGSIIIENAKLFNDNLILLNLNIEKTLKVSVLIDKSNKIISNLFFDSYNSTDNPDIIELNVNPLLIYNDKNCFNPQNEKMKTINKQLIQKWKLNLKTNLLSEVIEKNSTATEYKSFNINNLDYRELYMSLPRLIGNYKEYPLSELNSLKRNYDYDRQKLSFLQRIKKTNELYNEKEDFKREESRKLERLKKERIQEQKSKDRRQTINIIIVIILIINWLYVISR